MKTNWPFIISSTVFILTLPLLIFFYIILRLVAFSVFLIAKVQHGKKLFLPSSMDVLAGLGSKNSIPYYNCVFVLEGDHVQYETVRKRFEEIFTNDTNISTKWRSILTSRYGYSFWLKSSSFDINNHVKLIEPCSISNRTSVITVDETKKIPDENYNNSAESEDLSELSWEEIVHRFATRYGSREVRDGLPKWELLLLKENEQRFTCLFRVSHTICDGMHFKSFMTKVLTDKSDDITVPNVQQKSSKYELSKLKLAVKSFCLLPYGLYASKAFKDKNLLHGVPLCGRKNFFITKPLSLNKIRNTKDTFNATVNDLVVSSVSQSITDHFVTKSETVPEVTSLMPMGREIDGDLRMRNDVAITSVKLPSQPIEEIVSSEDKFKILSEYCQTTDDRVNILSSVLRLALVKKNLAVAKTSPVIMSLSWFFMIISTYLPLCIVRKILFMDGITLNISNIRGPSEKDWSIAGYKVDRFCFLLNDKDPLGLAVSVLSFNNNIRFGLIVDEALMTKEEARTFILNVVKEMENLDVESHILQGLKRNS